MPSGVRVMLEQCVVSYVTGRGQSESENRRRVAVLFRRPSLPEDHMFEQEIEMEKKESSIVPLLLIVTLILAVVCVSIYFVVQSRKVLTSAEANSALVGILDAQGPAILHFETGILKSGDKPRDPNYRLLEKAGYLKIGKDTSDWKTPVALTPKGEAFLAELEGVKKSKDKDGAKDEYAVPLAQRKLVEIGKITMLTPSKATVEFTWKWETNKAGDLFDAGGPAVKAFNTWDRSTLIDKYGAHFYHAAPTKVVVALQKSDKGWQAATE
jgi:hypothetical protein